MTTFRQLKTGEVFKFVEIPDSGLWLKVDAGNCVHYFDDTRSRIACGDDVVVTPVEPPPILDIDEGLAWKVTFEAFRVLMGIFQERLPQVDEHSARHAVGMAVSVLRDELDNLRGVGKTRPIQRVIESLRAEQWGKGRNE